MTADNLPAHSPLGASGCARWLACSGSVAAEAAFPDDSTSYSREGDLAHALAELCIVKGFDAEQRVGLYIDVKGESMQVPADMAEPVQIYVDYCRELMREAGRKRTAIEGKFQIAHVDERLFGTCDYTALLAKQKRLHVVDYKHGAGVFVPVEENKQALFYATGAWHALGCPDIDEVVITVVQPRIGDPAPAHWPTTVDRLVEFELELAAGVKRVDNEPDKRTAGEHCRFCKARATCKTFEAYAVQTAAADFEQLDTLNLDHLTPAEVAERLDKIKPLQTWIKAIQEYAHNEAQARPCACWLQAGTTQGAA